MIKKQNPRNFAITAKLTRVAIDQIKRLADAEHMSPASYIHAILIDRINFEIEQNNPALIPQDYLPLPSGTDHPAQPAAPHPAPDQGSTEGTPDVTQAPPETKQSGGS